MIDECADPAMQPPHHNVPATALPESVMTIIDEFILTYTDEHLKKTIMGRGLGLEINDSTIRKYCEHARRVLTVVATNHTTSETQLRAALESCDIEEIIMKCCLTPSSGAARVKNLTKLRALLDFAQVSSEAVHAIITQHDTAARKLAKQNHNVKEASHAFSSVGLWWCRVACHESSSFSGQLSGPTGHHTPW